MFAENIYIARRRALRERLRTGIVLLPGNVDAPINFAHNAHPFRQDATFRYFFGINRPGLVALLDLESGEDVVFGDDATLDDEIWLGKTPSLASECERAGCRTVRGYAALQAALDSARRDARKLHFLPPYRAATTLEIGRLMGVAPQEVARCASTALIDALVALREVKGAEEIEQIEAALAVTDEMHRAAMRAVRPGAREREGVAQMHAVLAQHGVLEAYQSVFTKRGEILHNFNYDGRLAPGDLVVNDSGATSAFGYASDITRTLPVSGQFDTRQRELYTLLLEAQDIGIRGSRPGVRYADVHRAVVTHLAGGMLQMGIFKGSVSDIVSSGAYAVVFPHGLGHQLGLDVHDMESYGEDRVGYDVQTPRSTQFGLRSLRMGKPLKAGMVLTVEPGIYFIEALIERWAAERRHEGLIDYATLRACVGLGGMRVEDEIEITATGARVMGPPIPKTVSEIEAAMAD